MARPNGGRPGRNSKLTDEMIAKIVELVEVGNYVEVACAAVGISDRSYYNWIGIGRNIEQEHGDDPEQWPEDLNPYDYQCGVFFESIKQATAQAEAFAVASIRKQMPTQWAAAMTYLERRYPGRWKRRDELTVANPFDVQGAAGAQIDEAALLRDPDATRLMHEALAQVAGRSALPVPVTDDATDAVVVDSTAEDA
jgi:hypothetical protein